MGGQNRYNTIWSTYIGFLRHFRAPNRFICPYKGFLGAPRGSPKVQKWVKGPSPVILGQLDHYVVFRTKSGVNEDFQRGKGDLYFKL